MKNKEKSQSIINIPLKEEGGILPPLFYVQISFIFYLLDYFNTDW